MSTSLLPLALFVSMSFAYNMDHLITCFENNDETYLGYRDPIWGDPESDMSKTYPLLHEAYMNSDFPGKGDVCDHSDPVTQLVRDTCYFNVNFGDEINDEKTWSYKCWDFSRCPIKDPVTGEPVEGCQFTDKRANCCCRDDFCNGNELIEKIAALGNPDNYPIDWDEVCTWEWGDIDVYFNVAGYESCGNKEVPLIEQETEEKVKGEGGKGGGKTKEEENNYSAAYHNLPQYMETASSTTTSLLSTTDILLIASYFVIGILSLGIGIFIGSHFKQSLYPPSPMMFKPDPDSI